MEEKENLKKKVLIINSGGTISMVKSDANNKNSPLRPSKSWSEVTENYQFLKEMDADYVQLSRIIDSSDMNYELWFEIGKIIEESYEDYKGFVVLHGTDTMAYTASALSFILKNLDKPVILTGAQRPIQEMRSDGLQNLLTSIEIILGQCGDRKNETMEADEDSSDVIPVIPEVCIFFRDYLLRGNRARKLDSTNYFGFSSPNYLPLGEAGSKIRIHKERLLPLKNEESRYTENEDFRDETNKNPSGGKFYVDYTIDTNILNVELFPGFNPEILENIFSGSHNIRGLILRSYGSGNTPQDEKFLSAIRRIIDSGAVILNITQCTVGRVETGMYESNAVLTSLGVVNGSDMTPEAAITKLMYLLGKYDDINTVKKKLTESIAGELTE